MKLPPGHVPGMGVHKATAYGGFGQKMLEKMGWSKGQGLGKTKHGMKEAIEVKKKEDTLGVGANTTGWKWDWKYWEDAYNTGLQSISKSDSNKTGRKKPSSSSNSDSKSSSVSGSSSDSEVDSDDDSSESDDEHNARLAEACGVVYNRDGTAASASAAELKLAQQLAKDARGPAGRFGGREGKMARIRQQEAQQAAAMQAKLGIRPSASAGDLKDSSASEDTSAGNKRRKRKQPGTAGGSSSDEDASAATAGRNKKKSKKQKNSSRPDDSSDQQQQRQTPGNGDQAAAGPSKSRLIVVVAVKGAGPNVEAFKAFKPTPSTGWWGAKMFISAGLLEGLDEEQQQRHRERTTFDEDMQTAVYMAAHGAQRQGRRGLGKSTTLQIAGGRWQGKKVTFDHEGTAEPRTCADEQPGGEQQRQQPQQAAANGAVSRPSSDDAGTAKAAGDPQGSTHVKKRKQQKPRKSGKVKWANLAVEKLQGAPGGVLKWSRLWKHLKQAAAQQNPGIVEESCREKKAWKKLQGCSQLQVTGKLVSLAA